MTTIAPENTRDRSPLPVEVRKATADDHRDLVFAMARAFDDDPVANWFVAQDERRVQRIRLFFNTALKRLTMPHDQVYTTTEIHGGALWTPPGKWKLGTLQQILLTPEMAKATSWRRMPTVFKGLNAVEKKHPQEPHYYLLGLGVVPELQGRSVGTQLMRPVLEICDRDRVPAYLESSKEINVPLYERNGFRVTEEMVIPGGGPRIWLMWRDPK